MELLIEKQVYDLVIEHSLDANLKPIDNPFLIPLTPKEPQVPEAQTQFTWTSTNW